MKFLTVHTARIIFRCRSVSAAAVILLMLLLPLNSFSQWRYGFDFDRDFEWIDLLIDEQAKINNAQEQVKYLRNEFSIEEGRILLSSLAKLESVNEIKNLHETAMLDVPVNRDKFSEIFRTALQYSEFQDNFIGLMNAAVTLAKIRDSFGEEKKPFDNRQFFINPAENFSNGITINPDLSGAYLILDILKRGLNGVNEDELLTTAGTEKMINHSKKPCITIGDLIDCIKIVNNKDPMIQIYKIINPLSFMCLGSVNLYAKDYVKALATLENDHKQIINYCLYLLAPYFPEEIVFSNNIYFVFGNRNCCWRTDDDEILFDLSRFGDNFELMIRYITRELFKDEKKYITLDVFPYLYSNEDTIILKVLSDVYTGGISNYIAPIISTNRPSELLEKDFIHFKKTLREILDKQPLETIDSLINIGSNETMFFHSMGTQMAGTIDNKMGRKAIRNAVILGPVLFFKTYIELYNNKDHKIRTIFRLYTDIERKIFAMSSRVSYDMLDDMQFVKRKFISSPSLQDEVNGIFAKYRDRKDLWFLNLLAGQLYLEAGLYDNAVGNFKLSLPGIIDRKKFLNEIGTKLYTAAAYAQALSVFDIYVECDVLNADAYLKRGMTNYELGNIENAKIDLERVLEIEPDNGTAKEYLSKL